MAEAQSSTVQAQGVPRNQTKAKVCNSLHFCSIASKLMSCQAYVSPGVSLIAGGVAGGVEAMCTVSMKTFRN
jgi:solute carrier family 25 citrate transporter 1